MAYDPFFSRPFRFARLIFHDVWAFVLWCLSPLRWLTWPDARASLHLDHINRETRAEAVAMASPFRAFIARALTHGERIGDGFSSGSDGGHILQLS